jgi:hypothetical protein
VQALYLNLYPQRSHMEQQVNQDERDFSTISPSARTLLLLKGITNIPFAKEAATIISQPETYAPDLSNTDLVFWGRAVHFESRYWSINQLMEGLPAKNILELSSGFSFRGLEAAKEHDVHYIDTDLPGMVDSKKQLIQSLHPGTLKGTLELQPLNALDENSFMEIVSHFPEGEILIVNEGLLMYLNDEEKRKACGIIHKVLKARGGYWITADIYVKGITKIEGLKVNDELQQFLAAHQVEENKFDSFEAAQAFFESIGFIVDKEAEPNRDKLTTLPYLLQHATPQQLQELGKAGRIQTTWRLKVAE